MNSLDQVQINFNNDSLIVLKIILAIIMYGVALDIRSSQIKSIVTNPKSIIVGMIAQFIIFPFFSFLLMTFTNPPPSVAIGMLVVASCPGGNVSNYLTYLSRGNTALSVIMTFFSTIAALVMTPFNINFWGKMYGPTNELVQNISLNPYEVMESVIFLLGIPLVIGLMVRKNNESLADKHEKFLKKFSMIFLALFVVGALVVNFKIFLENIHHIIGIVFLQNGIALLSGYGLATICKLNEADRRAVTIEVGIQNSGLGLALIFEFFKGIGGAAIVAAWWGVWHAVSGFTLAYWWTRKRNLKFLESHNEKHTSHGF
jgi:BASS family bile acid:Na+ symporter